MTRHRALHALIQSSITADRSHPIAPLPFATRSNVCLRLLGVLLSRASVHSVVATVDVTARQLSSAKRGHTSRRLHCRGVSECGPRPPHSSTATSTASPSRSALSLSLRSAPTSHGRPAIESCSSVEWRASGVSAISEFPEFGFSVAIRTVRHRLQRKHCPASAVCTTRLVSPRIRFSSAGHETSRTSGSFDRPHS